MQIQRIQTLWLILATIAAGISFAFPWLKVEESVIDLTDNMPMLILGILAGVLSFVTVFLYRNVKRQKTTCRIAVLFSLCTIVYTVALSYFGPNPDAQVCISGPSLMALSCIFDYMALKGIRHDEKLLRDSDRLR